MHIRSRHTRQIMSATITLYTIIASTWHRKNKFLFLPRCSWPLSIFQYSRQIIQKIKTTIFILFPMTSLSDFKTIIYFFYQCKKQSGSHRNNFSKFAILWSCFTSISNGRSSILTYIEIRLKLSIGFWGRHCSNGPITSAYFLSTVTLGFISSSKPV